MASWQRILRAAVDARYRLPSALPERDRYPIGRAAGGCLTRIVLLVMFILVAFLGGLFLVARALL